MYCEHCGNKIQDGYKFCTKCGNLAVSELPRKVEKIQLSEHNDKWWYRLLRVMYILMYIPLPFILMIVWSSSNSTYDYYTSSRVDTTGTAFCYSIIAVVIYFAIVRLIKIAVVYIAVGRKPEWNKEFKKLF